MNRHTDITILQSDRSRLRSVLDQTFDSLRDVLRNHPSVLTATETGRVISVSGGTARVSGLATVRSQEVVRFPGNHLGLVFNLDPDEVGVILLDKESHLRAGAEVHRTNQILQVPVGDSMLGRVVDSVGRPRDGRGAIRAARQLPTERPSPAIMDRAAVTVPLQTGIKVVDALVPIGRGQRELILGDRQTGKTAIALDSIINQHDSGVLCVYCAIGQRSAAVARVVADLDRYNARQYTTVVISTEDDPPGVQFVAPYAAMSIAEHFMERGRDVLVVFDDLTRHARAYRELSLLLRRPPGREAFPGDVFYIHSRLLERSTHVRPELGGGSITALPIVETEAQNISAYIPTNLISITDGQIYLSPELFDKGILPAVDVGKSVSRVGGKSQLPSYRNVVGDLRLSFAQFGELESFARFGTRLDTHTRQILDRGRRVREILKQPQYERLAAHEQVAVLIAVNAGVFDATPLEKVSLLESALTRRVSAELPGVREKITAGEDINDEDRNAILQLAKQT